MPFYYSPTINREEPLNSALNAADSLIVPVDSSFYGLAGLKKLLAKIEEIRSGYNPELQILGFLLTLFDPTRLSTEIFDELVSVFGEQVFETKIRRSVRLREAPALGRTIFQHAPGSSGAEDHIQLAHKILQRLGRMEQSTFEPSLRLVSGGNSIEVAHE